MPPLVMDTEWHADALRMRAEGLDANAVAEAMGKHPFTIRRLFARNPPPEPPIVGSYPSPCASNGNGHATVDAETAERIRKAAETGEVWDGAKAHDDEPIPGQTTVDEHLAGFKYEAGEAVGDLEAQRRATRREMDGGETVHVEEIRVDGTTQLGMFDAGGKSPESASLRLSGGKILLVDGRAFAKGDTIRFEGTAVVREVALRDRPDPKTGVVVSAEQKHVAQITDLRVT